MFIQMDRSVSDLKMRAYALLACKDRANALEARIKQAKEWAGKDDKGKSQDPVIQGDIIELELLNDFLLALTIARVTE